MNRFAVGIIMLTVGPFSALAAPNDAPSYVNTLIGTQRSAIGYGGTMPFVTTPFGMTSWTPQTRQNKISVTSYNYDDTTISGFIGTHQPAIWMGDYGYVTVIPQVGELRTTPESRKLAYNHGSEKARPDYYRVSLDTGADGTIQAEMTARERGAIVRFTFPKTAKARIIVEASRPGIAGMAAVNPETREITGYNPHRMDAHLGPFALPKFKGYFVVQFQQTPVDMKTYGMDGPKAESSRGAYAEFKPGQTIQVRVGTSFISIEQARANLQHELSGWNFQAVQEYLRAKWNEKLSRIQVDGATEQEKTRLYTAVYHTLLYPRIFSEYGHYYSAFDDTIHAGESYTAYSIWDTFRAENSMLTLLAPERIDGMITALLQNFKEGGWMPKWPNPSYTNIMIATHADAVVAEAINKGFHGFDYRLAYEAAYKDAMTPPEGDTTRDWHDRQPGVPYEARPGLTYYKQLGYVPVDKTAEAASETLEDAYDDFAVAQVAKALGRDKDFRLFIGRSRNYRNLYNPARGFMQGRNADGSWARPEDGWTEGDQWVYTYSVLHDIAGLMALMGGPEKFNATLDEHFQGGHNRHDNEPSHHYGYLYDFSGQPWKTQLRVREIARDSYQNRPAGVLGNEDCGQMSAWYIFTAMGFYPLNPVSGNYMIGSPLFRKFTLNLPGGKRFVIAAPQNSATNVYIQSARLNGEPLHVPVVTHAQLEAGGLLEFDMGPAPSQWGSIWSAAPLPELPD